MAIFRGSGGAGDATNNITINRVTELSQEAEASATAAASSATLSANSATSASDSATASASSATDAQTAQNAAETAKNAAETAKANTETIYDNFDDRYLGAKSSAPPLDNDGEELLEGALYFNTTDDKLYVWTGSIWRLATSNIEAIADRKTYTVGTASGAYTGSLNTFPIVYDVGQIDVYLNGIKLINGTDFTATSETDVVLTVDATSGDLINLTGYGIFSIVDGETDPVVGAINGIVKADGAGTISAAVAGTDYIATANSISIGDLSDVDTTGISDNDIVV